MNANDEGARSEGNPSLSGFYTYKNTFDRDTVWLDIPRQLTFFNTTNPYLDPGEPDANRLVTAGDGSASNQQQVDLWEMNNHMHDPSLELPPELHPFGLEALSAAALCHPPKTDMISHSRDDRAQSSNPFETTSAANNDGDQHFSLSATLDSSSDPSYLGNTVTTLDSPIDPSLMSPDINQRRAPAEGRPTSLHGREMGKNGGEAESEQKVACLLRHFSESPGQWMDLFDLGNYFRSHVPVQARSHPLLKHAACACAAKQLGRARRTRGGAQIPSSLNQEHVDLNEDASIDWEWEGAYHYDKSIALLMETMRQGQSKSGSGGPDAVVSREEGLTPMQACITGPTGDLSDRANTALESDEVVAATAILCVYEFLSATGVAWSRHLNGTKSLLDIAERTMMPLETATLDAVLLPKRQISSNARRATFWNFARQDYVASFLNECQTRLDTDDLQLWRNAGLSISEDGFVLTNNFVLGNSSHEDTISNALVWISSRICNYIAAGEGFDPVPAGDRSEMRISQIGEVGKSQESLLQKWHEICKELDVWFEGLPETFKPSARIKSAMQRPFSEFAMPLPTEHTFNPFDEIWYSVPMCGATMQHYHMARILLLVNKPHETTAGRTTIARRTNSYREILEEMVSHCYEICGISRARPEASVRVHSTQALFVAGQCLTDPRERKVILDLLRDIETDLGWATGYRVQQLQREWGWVSDSDVAD